jgi:hypothetical protein
VVIGTVGGYAVLGLVAPEAAGCERRPDASTSPLVLRATHGGARGRVGASRVRVLWVGRSPWWEPEQHLPA